MIPFILCDFQNTLDRQGSDLLVAKLLEFKQEGVKACVVSDGGTHFVRNVIEPELQSKKLYNYQESLISAIYGVDHIGYKKEHPDYWTKGISANFGSGSLVRIFLVDDNKDIIANAKENGIACFHIDEDKEMEDMLPELEATYKTFQQKLALL